MHIWLGTQAFHSFQYQKLKQTLSQQGFKNSLIFADIIYVIHAPSLNDDESQRLNTLLQAKPATSEWLYQLWVVPRLGTISPWSSKLMSILHHCDIESVTALEKGIAYQFHREFWNQLDSLKRQRLIRLLYDPMTESALESTDDLKQLWAQKKPQPLAYIPLLKQGKVALEKVNNDYGLALNKQELDYLTRQFLALNRNPTDVELMTFAQVNSEHCRHKIFNARYEIEGVAQPYSLFEMIKKTYSAECHSVLVAYDDNAAILKGGTAEHFYADPKTHHYQFDLKPVHPVFKVETHNHPSAISPFSGAATGVGGEIRDEAACGCGAQTKIGLCGFSVSHLHIPNLPQPWEFHSDKPNNISSSLEIMLEAPVGAASFNNEFGRPNLLGYFRSCELKYRTDYGEVIRGYHKPIMLAGGIGQMSSLQVKKKELPVGALLIVLGGPAMPIGLGGGALSSQSSGQNDVELDFASVQRANAEMQRRAQEVINSCMNLGEANPILSIHDVGAGGLSNAIPELVHADTKGAIIRLHDIPNEALGMSPMEYWCNEAQERYVLALMPNHLACIEAKAQRERCPLAVVGEITAHRDFILIDEKENNKPMHLPLALLFETLPPLMRSAVRLEQKHAPFTTDTLDLAESIQRVLQFPAVADKSFLITIADRSVGGLVARDQMVGPWSIPVADVAVSANSFTGYGGEAMALGEKAPIALVHHGASARMALGEAITNIAAAAIDDISDIVLSANWMAAADYPGESAGLYDAVQTLSLELCQALGIPIVVGKDSLSMRATWTSDHQEHSVTSPLSLVITALARVSDIRKTLTPQIQIEYSDSLLLLIDLGKGAHCLAGSVLCQVYAQLGQRPPDVDDPEAIKSFFHVIQRLNRANKLLAYHDRSDGGLLVTIVEMMFAGRAGVELDLDDLGEEVFHALFNEELGAVIQVEKKHLNFVTNVFKEAGLGRYVHRIGRLNSNEELIIRDKGRILYRNLRQNLHRFWSETSYQIQTLRDNPKTAKEAFDNILHEHKVGTSVKLNFLLTENPAAPYIHKGLKPQCAILREQGINGHVEMAAAFTLAGFKAVDVHMTDLISKRVHLNEFSVLALCGGFSYGDVPRAGCGFAQSILMNSYLYDSFSQFFCNKNTLTLGVCNGCQVLSQLKSLIPGGDDWPFFIHNHSYQFEARLVSVKIEYSPSILMQGMEGSHLPVVVAHQQGCAQFALGAYERACANRLIVMRYIDDGGYPTERFPYNPNGSIEGTTGLTTYDGRVTMMMPHPERVFRSCQLPWHPKEWGEESPWLRLFRNARAWLG